MNRKSDQKQRYIQDRLIGAEREEFEDWMLENGDAEDWYELKLDNAMRRGFMEFSTDEIQELSPNSEADKRDISRWAKIFFKPLFAAPVVALLIAAIAIPTIVSIQLANQNQAQAELIAILGQPNDTIYTLELGTVRGDSDDPQGRIVLGNSPFTVLLNISALPWREQEKELVVTIQVGDREFILAEPKITSDGFIQLGLNSASLQVGTVTVSVRNKKRRVAKYVVAVEKK